PMVAMVVDDEPLIRLPVGWALEDRGFEVVEVDSGDAALALFQEGVHVDLLITDVRMPGETDGFELVEHVRRMRGALPIIVMSGMPWDPGAQPSPIRRDITFLQKPASLNQLMGAIDELLGEHLRSAAPGADQVTAMAALR